MVAIEALSITNYMKSFEVQEILINCLKVIPQFCTAHPVLRIKIIIIKGMNAYAF